FRFVLDRDFIAGLHVVGSDVDAASVDLNMAVRHELARSIASVGEAEPVNHIIEAGLKKLEQGFNRYTTFAHRVLENAAELAFEKSILITKLLFLAERDRVFGLFPAGPFWPVHSRRIIFSLERFRLSKKLDGVTGGWCFFSFRISFLL